MPQNALNPTLLAMLACPSDDHAPLREESHDGVDTLVCTHCATRFPIDDGIPVLLLDDATPGPRGVGIAADSTGGEPAAAVPAVVLAPDEVLVAEPAEPIEPVVLAAEVVDVAEVVEVADVLDADDVAPAPSETPLDQPAAAPVVASPVSAPTDPRRPQNPSPPRTLGAALRNRVEHRLAEYEANRGPRRRRGSGR